jgi:hypothetical protein
VPTEKVQTKVMVSNRPGTHFHEDEDIPFSPSIAWCNAVELNSKIESGQVNTESKLIYAKKDSRVPQFLHKTAMHAANQSTGIQQYSRPEPFSGQQS